jgi:hypothetical protein
MDTKIHIDELDNDEKKILFQHEIKKEDDQFENTWRSCCLVMDRRAIQFFSQLITISSIMLFCIVQLIHDDKNENHRTEYMSLLTFLIGVLIPSPKLL